MREGLLFTLFARAALGSGAIHPFAKYKDLALRPSPAPAAASAPPLECFQVAEPVLTPSGLTRRDESSPPAFVPANQNPIVAEAKRGDVDAGDLSPCAVVLMEHTFANSYGFPFVGNYTPPACAFDHVVINFTTLVKGRQYDRTGIMYLNDTEVWRTSTAEPNPTGIRWEWLKDMTAFLSLWREPQTIIFDLENNVDSTYTGLINTTLTATFFTRPNTDDVDGVTPFQPADLIIPISKRLGASGMPSQFVYPGDRAENTITNFPRNANRAVFTVDVKGQANEEFWWSNVPQSAIYAFNSTYGEYPGYSPFREVQVLIDGYLAGVSWPFPVIYTGGIVPQLHRPIVGVQAFDIIEHEIDISPFLPLLCDGKPHTFEIKVLGLVDDGGSRADLSTTTDDEWYVTGKIFLWLDDAESVTTGVTLHNFGAPPPPIITLSQSLTKDANGTNQTLEYNLSVSREVAPISAYVKTQRTTSFRTWSQSLAYSNVGGVSNYGNNNLNTFLIHGVDKGTGYTNTYAYPLFANSTSATPPDGSLALWAQVNQSLQVDIRGSGALPTGLEEFLTTGAARGAVGSSLRTSQNGTADYYRPGSNNYTEGVGETRQIFSFGALGRDGRVAGLYSRDVSAYNDSVTADRVTIAS
ncbi:peptide N-acetyl-beta-D-glucosaminyl asparaginase amidase A-domain-containing protein [Xylaria intraflava]|nr:peptide N-acetyl-beta-D-glucosaminyl asparaginase amidase A-domain-containing protein [Xylaria intraflava]